MQHRHKFIAPGAVNRAVMPQGIRKTLGSSNNQRVSGLVAERIVDFFQSVQIHQNHAQCPGAAAPIPKILPHGAAVSQPGKLVHQGKAALFNQLTVVLLCSLMIPLRRYNFNEKREETTGFIEASGRQKTRPPQSRNRLRGKLDSLPSQRYDSWLFHALLHHTAPCRHR